MRGFWGKLVLTIIIALFCTSDVQSQTSICNGTTCDNTGTVLNLDSVKSQMNSAPHYITGFTANSPGLLADLYSLAPCNSVVSNYYAVVSDLYGTLTDTLRCTNFGAWGYGWRPTIPFYATTVVVSGGTLAIACNVTAPVVRLSGTLTSSLMITFNNNNCTPGQRQEIQVDVTTGLYTVNTTGFVGGTVSKALGAPSTSLYIFDSAGWRTY